MKKLFAVVLALMLAMTASLSLAEGTVVQMGANYDITIDVPAGYTMNKILSGSLVMADFEPADAAAAKYTLVIEYSEEFGDYILNDLTAEETAQMKEMLTADFADAVVTFPTTKAGTKLIQIDEQGSESEYGLVLTIYHGYFVQITLTKANGVQLTAEEYQTAIDLMSSLQMVELSK